MGFESMVTVQAEVCDIGKIKEAAQVLLDLMLENPDEVHDPAKAFLAAVAKGKAFQYGNKGDVLLWGGIWNYFREDDFTPWLARLIEATTEEWNTNIHLSWEQEQSESRSVKVFWWSCRGGKLLWAEVPPTQRMHWGVCGDSGPSVGDEYPTQVILDVEGKKYPDHDTCRRCGTIVVAKYGGWHWEGAWRKCPHCKTRIPVLKAHLWKEPDDE